MLTSLLYLFSRIVDNWFCGISATSPYDLAIAYTTCPDRSGFVVGELNGVVVGSAARVPWGDNILYVSLFYVEEKLRGSRFGKKLALTNVEYMANTKKVGYADSVKERLEMNQALFRMKITPLCTVRYQGVAQKHQQDNPRNEVLVKVVWIKTNFDVCDSISEDYYIQLFGSPAKYSQICIECSFKWYVICSPLELFAGCKFF